MQRFAHVSQLFLHFSQVLQKETFREYENKSCKIQLIRNADFVVLVYVFCFHAAKVNDNFQPPKYFWDNFQLYGKNFRQYT